jgi:hypothetical protein
MSHDLYRRDSQSKRRDTQSFFNFRLRLQPENAKQCGYSIRTALCSQTEGVNLFFSENLCACSGNLCATIKRCFYMLSTTCLQLFKTTPCFK